jgi:DNA-binding Xre family transcriptional regulator
MAGGVDYEWRLRLLLAERGLFQTSDLAPLLAERGVELSDSQVWRLVTGKPERLNLHTLMVLCDILECTTNDLIRRVDAPTQARPRKRRAAGESRAADIEPKPARIRPARPRGGR